MRKLICISIAAVLAALGVGAVGVSALGAEPGHVVTIADLTTVEGNGNDTDAVAVTVTVAPAPELGEQVEVDFGTSAQAAQGATATTTAAGDATPEFPEDFAQADGTVTFDVLETEKTIYVPVLGDNSDEGDETFFVRLFNARTDCLILDVCGTPSSIGDSSSTVTITDDDAAPVLSINNKTDNEGHGPGPTDYGFTVTKVGGSALDVTVDYSTADGTASSESDYGAAAGTLTFGASSPSDPETKTVNVVVNGDETFEPSETFTLNLADATNATIADGEGLGTILNDDEPPPPALAVSDASGNEGDTQSFTLSLSSPPSPGQTAIVDWSLSTADGEGDAAEGVDYADASGTVVYTAGETEQTVSVPTTEDAVNELDEHFTLTLEKPAVYGSGGYTYEITDEIGTGTIVNDDEAPVLSIDDVTIAAEGGSEVTTTATFTVTKAGLTDRAVGVDFTAADGTASASDYESSQGELSFAADEVAKEVTVQVNGDAVYEADETFVVDLENAVNATIADAQGVGTISNDDAAPTLAVADVAVTEGNSGPKAMTFTVTKVGSTALDATVSFATANAMAKSGSDYGAGSGSLVFTPAQTEKPVTINVLGDALDEWNETFTLNLSLANNAAITDGQAVGRILDDDAAPSMSINDGKVNESSTSACALTVRLGAPSGRAISVHYTTVSGTAGTSDYVAKSGDLTFARGETAKQIKVVARGDTLVEGTERFAVKLSGISPSAGAVFSDSTGKCFIIDND